MSDETEFKCPDCGALTDDVDSHTANCPECGHGGVRRMEAVNCDCGGVSFRVVVADRSTTTTPTVVCEDCGRTGEVDDARVRWSA